MKEQHIIDTLISRKDTSLEHKLQGLEMIFNLREPEKYTYHEVTFRGKRSILRNEEIGQLQHALSEISSFGVLLVRECTKEEYDKYWKEK